MGAWGEGKKRGAGSHVTGDPRPTRVGLSLGGYSIAETDRYSLPSKQAGMRHTSNLISGPICT